MLVSDVEFLTKFASQATTVVIISSAVYRHFSLLADSFFPNHNFIIYCPEPPEVCGRCASVELGLPIRFPGTNQCLQTNLISCCVS